MHCTTCLDHNHISKYRRHLFPYSWAPAEQFVRVGGGRGQDRLKKALRKKKKGPSHGEKTYPPPIWRKRPPHKDFKKRMEKKLF